jgi:4-hydroxy-4-methyl-2-oxoglutarate aldolase
MDRLRGLTVADLSDALSGAGHPPRLLGQSLWSLTSGARICGQAVTAFCAKGDGLMSHCALFLAHPGDVLVLADGGSGDAALFGGNMAIDARALGVAGIIVDGPVRDVSRMRALKLPLWARSTSPRRGAKKGEGSVNMPLSCAGALVNPGDIIVADDDGILALAPFHIDEIVHAVQRKLVEESALARRIEQGERIFRIAGLDKLLEQMRVSIEPTHWIPPLPSNAPSRSA